MGKFLVTAALAATMVTTAGNADAALIVFTGPTFPDFYGATFADGVFGNGQGLGGFYQGQNKYTGVSYVGPSSEYIRFNAPVTLNSLTIGPSSYYGTIKPISFSINLYDMSSLLISSTLVHASSTPEVVKLDQAGVQKVEFSFTGAPGGNTWYEVSDVSYDLGGGVPEPAVWALMIGGFGLVGASLRRRRPRAA